MFHPAPILRALVLVAAMLAAGPAVAITGNVRPAMREQAARLLAVRNP